MKKPLNIQYPLKDLRIFVDSVQKKYKDKYAAIYFFGGEPSMDYLACENIMKEFVHVKAYEVNFILHTNGLLLGSLPQKILQRLDVIILSLNYEKIYHNEKLSDYYYDIVKNVKSLKQKQNIPIIGRLTIVNTASLYKLCDLTKGFCDYVYWQIDNRADAKQIEEYKTEYKKEITLLFNHWMMSLRQDAVINYIPFLGIVRNIIDNSQFPDSYYCGYGYYSVFVQTDGTCYACCEAVECGNHKIGNISKGIEFVDMDLTKTKCPDCEYLKICGGRCGRMHKDFSEKRINDFCELNIFTFKLIENALPEIKKLLKNNPVFFKAIFDYHLDYTELMP